MAVYTYVDDGSSAAALARPAGGASLTLTAGTGGLFKKPAPPSPSAPLKVAIFRGGARVGVLLATAVAGDVLTVSGPLSGPDFAVQAGDVVEAVPLAEDLLALQDADAALAAAIGECVSTADLPAALADYALKTYVDAAAAGKEPAIAAGAEGQFWRGDKSWQPISSIVAGLATTTYVDGVAASKQDALPTGATSSKYLGGDFAFHDLPASPAPKNLAVLASWTSSASSDLAAGDMAPHARGVPAAYTPAYLAINAGTNGASGGFTLQITVDGVDLLTSAVAYAAASTGVLVVSTGFALSTIPAGSKVKAVVATAGSGVRAVEVGLYGREA